MPEFDSYVQRYIKNKNITAEEAKIEAIIDSVRLYYENGDKIRAMTDEELAAVIICPYDTAGEPQNIMPCMVDDNVNPVSDNDCTKCCKKWLEREYEA